MTFRIAILQARDESVEVSGYKYVFVMRDLESDKENTIAVLTMYELIHLLHGAIDENKWVEIESKLSAQGAWTSELELDDDVATVLFNS